MRPGVRLERPRLRLAQKARERGGERDSGRRLSARGPEPRLSGVLHQVCRECERIDQHVGSSTSVFRY